LLADLTVLDQNPLTIDRLKIAGIKILTTIKEGKTVYSRPASPKQANVASRCADSAACFALVSHVLGDSGAIDDHQHEH